MSTPRALYLRVGALLSGSLLLLLGAVIAFTGRTWHQDVRYETYFRESVQGLDVGAPVKFRGVTLGHVSNIGLVSAEYGATAEEQVMDPTYRLIVVRFKINPARVGKLPTTDEAVRTGLRAKLANQGLTGVMYLELDFYPPSRYPPQLVPWTPDTDYIPSVPSTIAQVQDSVTQALQEFNRIDFVRLTDNVNGLVSDIRHDIGAQGDVHGALASARETIDHLRTQIDRADLPALSQQLRQTAASLQTLTDGRQTRAVLSEAEAALARLPPLLDSLQQTSHRAGGGVADIQAELIPILEDVRAAVQNIRETTEAIRRDPGSVLLQGPPRKEAK